MKTFAEIKEILRYKPIVQEKYKVKEMFFWLVCQ